MRKRGWGIKKKDRGGRNAKYRNKVGRMGEEGKME